MAKPKLYGLLVGINEYSGVRKLAGCLNDVAAVEQYLNSAKDFDVTIEKLTDSDATRDGIANAFRNHLAKAKEEDTVFFYFSGHGTQEEAAEIWEETDTALECLVCYDGETVKVSEFLLTDKELRYLIHGLYRDTKAHIVTVFDCCHSGDNTRNGALMLAASGEHETSERRITNRGSKFFPGRAWEDFLFSGEIREEDVVSGKFNDLIPQGTHIQIAACESNQTALEIGRRGVFTKTLLKTLAYCNSNISYNSLRSRIRQYMRASFEQTPRVYIPVDSERHLALGFLNRKIDPQKMYCEAGQDEKGVWQLNVGAIHGMKSDSKITLTDPLNREITFVASVKNGGVFIDYTLIEAEGLVGGEIYSGEISGLLTQELKLEIENRDATPEQANELIGALQQNASGGFAFGGEKAAGEDEKDDATSENADYTFHLNSGQAYITLPGDSYRPLIRPISFLDAGSTESIVDILRHISRWHFIRNLQNDAVPVNFPASPLGIELTSLALNGTRNLIDISGGNAFLEYEQTANGWKGVVQIKITNTTQKDLCVCAAYLTREFECFLKFLPQRTVLLEAGKSVLLGVTNNDGVKKDSISLSLGKVEQEYNWPSTLEVLKFIVSTTEFSGEALTLPAISQPLTTDDVDRGAGKSEMQRGLDLEDEPVEFSGWITQTLELDFKNPVFNQVSESVVKKLLLFEPTAFFAAGLYCHVEPDETGQPTIWKLKGVVEPEGERGLLGDVKIWLGNGIETTARRFRYRKLRKDKTRIRMVAEGDSWFQYPILLKDVIDQLYKRYAIRSFAEAGDTLENYLKKKEYVNAISEEGAKYFLVSGGGNDVVGEEFPGFLRNEDDFDPNDQTPNRYLKDTFTAQLDKLDRLYTEMFTELLDKFPKLHILVHCYDYVIPVDTALSKAMSWSGKHMIEKKIKPQLEREKLIIHILDSFAKRLEALSLKPEFIGKVSFIDTRGIVRRDGWKDEIHPQNEGFELVAAKFIAEINRIENSEHR